MQYAVAMTIDRNQRPLEDGIHRDLSGRITYAGYLRLDLLLAAQQPLSDPPHHDEMLFVVQHQVSELWLKLMIHELSAAIGHLKRDEVWRCRKVLARCKQVLRQLTEQWSVLETMTPAEYMEFRDVLGPSSGFQSLQYRTVEFLLGNKRASMLAPHRHREDLHAGLKAALEGPSLYDATVRLLARRGFAISREVLDRDLSTPHRSDPTVLSAWLEIYRDTRRHWDLYQLGEELVDLEDWFQQWRFRHMTTVKRIIGFKRGTGGTAGVGYLRRALDMTFFPELWEVRTELN